MESCFAGCESQERGQPHARFENDMTRRDIFRLCLELVGEGRTLRLVANHGDNGGAIDEDHSLPQSSSISCFVGVWPRARLPRRSASRAISAMRSRRGRCARARACSNASITACVMVVPRLFARRRAILSARGSRMWRAMEVTCVDGVYKVCIPSMQVKYNTIPPALKPRGVLNPSFRGARHKRVYARLRRAMASEPGIQSHTPCRFALDSGSGAKAPSRNDGKAQPAPFSPQFP